MNLVRYFTGCLKALGQSGWDPDSYFDLSRKGFKVSFLALLLSLPFYNVCAIAVSRHHAAMAQTDVTGLPQSAFILIFILYALSFVVSVYIITLIFDKQDRFRPWVIVRHWAMFFAALMAAILMGLNILGLLPFDVAIYVVMGIYLLTLAIDIRLAMRIGGFEWGAAILTGCLIAAMGLTILLIGVAQFM